MGGWFGSSKAYEEGPVGAEGDVKSRDPKGNPYKSYVLYLYS